MGWMSKGFNSWQGQEIFLFLNTSRLGLGPTRPPIHWIPGLLVRGVKPLGHQAYNSPPSTAKVKNEWNSTSVSILLHCIVFSTLSPTNAAHYGVVVGMPRCPITENSHSQSYGSLESLKTTTLLNTVSFHILSDSQFNSTFPVARATAYKLIKSPQYYINLQSQHR